MYIVDAIAMYIIDDIAIIKWFLYNTVHILEYIVITNNKFC
jgi:hypothetical protein